MPIDYNTSRHLCNSIRRQIQTSYPQLHIHFALYDDCTSITEAMNHSEAPLESTLKESTLALLEKNFDLNEKIGNQEPHHYALLHTSTKAAFNLIKKDHYTALCVIDLNAFNSPDILRCHVYHIAWSVLSHMKQIKEKTAGAPQLSGKNYALYTYEPRESELTELNLYADIFYAMCDFYNGKDSAPFELFKYRMTLTCNKVPQYLAENYAYPEYYMPLSTDITTITRNAITKQHAVAEAYKYTQGFLLTTGLNALEQWRHFSIPCQRLAWAGIEAPQIISAALVSSEDPYIQSISNFIVDRMQVIVDRGQTISCENPFASQAVNHDQHYKRCTAVINSLFSKVFTLKDHHILINAALKQTHDLGNGIALGWCAPALIKSAQILMNTTNDTDDEQAKAQSYQQALSSIKDVNWEILNDFAFRVFKNKRQTGTQTLETMLEIARQTPHFSAIQNTLERLIEQQNKINNQNEGGVAQFTSNMHELPHTQKNEG